MSSFVDKTCIITGGASGIGRAVGKELASRGAVVILADVDGDGAEAAAAAIRAAGGRAQAATLDVTRAGDVAELIQSTAEQHHGLDYVFNNAGIAVGAEADQHTLEDWHRTLDINLRGVVYGVQAAYPLMKAQGRGHIVNTASVAGLVPAPNQIAYVASKHAVVGLSNTLRAEAAAFGVRVSVVCPGFVDTPILFEHSTLKNPGRLQLESRDDVKKLIPFRAMPVETAARAIVNGVARNRGIILVTLHGRVLWWLYRLSPSIANWIGRKSIANLRKRKAQG